MGVKLISLMSGEFDSPVASYLMLKYGFELVYVHFDAGKFGDGTLLGKSIDSIRVLNDYFSKDRTKLYVVKDERFLEEIKDKCNYKYLFLLRKRFMYRCSERIMQRENALALVTGENLGQVASQTVDNLYVLDNAIKTLVFRPLITYNKEDIIALSKSIGTYDIAVRPSKCMINAPKHPTTSARLEDIEREEIHIDVNKHMEECLNNLEVIYV